MPTALPKSIGWTYEAKGTKRNGEGRRDGVGVDVNEADGSGDEIDRQKICYLEARGVVIQGPGPQAR
ncbi:hypothetical protein D9758_019019 [Tetrapyrgos nigripes]|uniref:Uncharacterized protein n=1 Tax=Tetrapyrgos nigripes TaxID=182062 RepID=A0A8H5BJ06_9AGAR|nr:hypothetical protein D9758_019019 [Tetrapyrgos nigripes]